MDYDKVVNHALDGMAKPPGSLGMLEAQTRKVLLAWREIKDEIRPYHIIFAADNGIISSKVVNYPPEITILQARNMVNGHATISSFCRCNHIPYCVVDVGIDSEESIGIDRKVARGTANFVHAEAMTHEGYLKAYQAGKDIVRDILNGSAINLLSFGEMGIGNTTTSSAVLHALTGILPQFIVGYGAGLPNQEVMKRKIAVINQAMQIHGEKMQSVHDMIRCVGGFDIAAMASAMVEAARQAVPFVIDGFIAAVAYACAYRMDEGVRAFAILSHISKEPGMSYALVAGGLRPEEALLHGEFCLGEGTGAILMVIMLRTMLYAIHNTARLEDFACLTVPGERPVRTSV